MASRASQWLGQRGRLAGTSSDADGKSRQLNCPLGRLLPQAPDMLRQRREGLQTDSLARPQSPAAKETQRLFGSMILYGLLRSSCP